MPMSTALIVIDSGFSQEALAGATQVLGVCDLSQGKMEIGTPYVDEATLLAFADDPMRHGSIVLDKLRTYAPEAPLVLVKAYGTEDRLIRTGWQNGRPVSRGWTEAYLWAVELCDKHSLASVANCSFGGFTHAMDGTGWEAFQIGRVVGKGKTGHVLVAAAGPGDGRAGHASWVIGDQSRAVIEVYQKGTTQYNLWESSGSSIDWILRIFHGEHLVAVHHGKEIPSNFWNNKQQLTFAVAGEGLVTLVVTRGNSDGKDKDSRFDCWVVNSGVASFMDHVDPTLICEPAIFPQVLSVGLRGGSYSSNQASPGGKPDVLVEGAGAISFRLPEVTAAVASLLDGDHRLGIDEVRLLMGKYPGRLPSSS